MAFAILVIHLGSSGPALRVEAVEDALEEAVALRVLGLNHHVPPQPLVDRGLHEADDRVVGEKGPSSSGPAPSSGRWSQDLVGRFCVRVRADRPGGLRCVVVDRPGRELAADGGDVPPHHVAVCDVSDHAAGGATIGKSDTRCIGAHMLRDAATAHTRRRRRLWYPRRRMPRDARCYAGRSGRCERLRGRRRHLHEPARPVDAAAIASSVRQSASSSRGLTTITARHCARETATFRRLRLKRKSSPRGTSSPDEHVMA